MTKTIMWMLLVALGAFTGLADTAIASTIAMKAAHTSNPYATRRGMMVRHHYRHHHHRMH